MKTSLGKILGLASFAVLCCFYVFMTTAENQPGQSSDAFAMRSAISLWNHYCQERVKKGDEVGKVKEVMAQKALDWGRLNFGGTGSYAVRFKLDDFMQAEFQFDRSNSLQSYRVFRQREFWVKDPDGNILYQTNK